MHVYRAGELARLDHTSSSVHLKLIDEGIDASKNHDGYTLVGDLHILGYFVTFPTFLQKEANTRVCFIKAPHARS